MIGAHTLYQLCLADVRERTRRYSFLVTMLGILFFGYLVITGQYTVQFGDCRTVYDSAWAGTLMAVCASIMLALVGFYLVKGSIARDRSTEVGQIAAATPIRSVTYLVSKLASNLAVLWFMAAILVLVAFVTLLFRNEAGTLDLWAFISPFLIITLPAIVFAAALAVLFDTARWLRGSAGNVIYLFVAEFCIVFGMLKIPLLDLAAVSAFTDSVRAAAAIAFPGETVGLIMGFVGLDPAMQVEEFRIFNWDGIAWTGDALVLRLTWIGYAAIATVIAIPLFDRFDLAKVGRKRPRRKAKPARAAGKEKRLRHGNVRSSSLFTLPLIRFKLVRILAAEVRLALKGHHWFWYAVTIGLAVGQLAAPFEVARMYLTPLAMAWPLVIWSSMGTRETRYNTGPMLFSAPDPITHQLTALWLSGLLVALAAVVCMVLRSVQAGEISYAAMLLIAAFLVPSASLALGTVSGSRKFFEVVYLMIWYVGSIDRLPALDLLGTTSEAITGTKFFVLGLLSLIFLIAAITARARRLSDA
jgi:hypothetical protein